MHHLLPLLFEHDFNTYMSYVEFNKRTKLRNFSVFLTQNREFIKKIFWQGLFYLATEVHIPPLSSRR